MKQSVAIIGLAVSLLVSGCADLDRRSYEQPKQTGGTVLGAIGGAVVGSQFGGGRGQLVGTAVGTLMGAYVGSQIGESLDHADKVYYQKAQQRAYVAPVGQQIVWNNPENGHSGVITPVREGTQAQTGALCREYQTQIVVGGRSEQGVGRACRQADGSWQIVQ